VSVYAILYSLHTAEGHNQSSEDSVNPVPAFVFWQTNAPVAVAVVYKAKELVPMPLALG